MKINKLISASHHFNSYHGDSGHEDYLNILLGTDIKTNEIMRTFVIFEILMKKVISPIIF